MTKERIIKVYTINHAMNIIEWENLEYEFEVQFGEVEDGRNYGDLINEKDITLNQLVDFLNKHKEHDETYILA